jgi:hypothetical protein
LLQQLNRDSISLVHTKEVDDGDAVGPLGLPEGVAVAVGLDGLVEEGLLEGMRLGLVGLLVDGRLNGALETLVGFLTAKLYEYRGIIECKHMDKYRTS